MKQSLLHFPDDLQTSNWWKSTDNQHAPNPEALLWEQHPGHCGYCGPGCLLPADSGCGFLGKKPVFIFPLFAIGDIKKVKIRGFVLKQEHTEPCWFYQLCLPFYQALCSLCHPKFISLQTVLFTSTNVTDRREKATQTGVKQEIMCCLLVCIHDQGCINYLVSCSVENMVMYGKKCNSSVRKKNYNYNLLMYIKNWEKMCKLLNM